MLNEPNIDPLRARCLRVTEKACPDMLKLLADLQYEFGDELLNSLHQERVKWASQFHAVDARDHMPSWWSTVTDRTLDDWSNMPPLPRYAPGRVLHWSMGEADKYTTVFHLPQAFLPASASPSEEGQQQATSEESQTPREKKRERQRIQAINACSRDTLKGLTNEARKRKLREMTRWLDVISLDDERRIPVRVPNYDNGNLDQRRRLHTMLDRVMDDIRSFKALDTESGQKLQAYRGSTGPPDEMLEAIILYQIGGLKRDAAACQTGVSRGCLDQWIPKVLPRLGIKVRGNAGRPRNT